MVHSLLQKNAKTRAQVNPMRASNVIFERADLVDLCKFTNRNLKQSTTHFILLFKENKV